MGSMTIPRLVAENIRKRRNELGWTQSRLAEEVGVHLTFISAIEGGRKFPSTATLEKLIEVLRLRPYELFLEEGVDESPSIQNKVFREFSSALIAEIPAIVKEHIISRSGDFITTK